MSALSEIAITPSVFGADAYGSAEVCEAHMQGIREALLEWVLVRDLRNGEWSRLLHGSRASLPRQATDLVGKMIKRRRLFPAPAELPSAPDTPIEWCDEALKSHCHLPLSGVLACPEVKAGYADEELVVAINRRSNCDWWQQNVVRTGQRVSRNTDAYLAEIGLVLRHANHIMIVDPHLDPTRPSYREIARLLLAAKRSDGVQPLIEIHRVAYIGSGRERRFPAHEEWEARFRGALDKPLNAAGLQVEIFIWTNEHDRHLISDLIGLHVGNGFDISEDPEDRSTWSRLDRTTRDSIQREFDPDVHPKRLRHRFLIGRA